jgi:eukaryotic-like serine/threonine-protein kinase
LSEHDTKSEGPTRDEAVASPQPAVPLGDEPGAPSFVSSAGPLPRGAQVNRYLILEVIGEGGMGRVYKAYDPQLDRKVALKLMLGVGDPLNRQRLLREAKAMARVADAHVVAVHDAGEAGDQVFVAMDYVEGKTLSQWLKAEPRPRAAQVLDVYRKAGAGLEAAHNAGLVHRDFKPANVLLGSDGRVCVTDFGLARDALSNGPDEKTSPVIPLALDGDSGRLDRLTVAGVVAGTPHYMAPEQFEGKEADARADQFSFCVALWEALYRSEPFPAETTAERIRKTSQGQLHQPTDKKGVPRHVHRALERGLSPRPDFRHRSMADLLQALARDTRPGVRWAPLGLAAAAVVAVAAFGYWRVSSARARACDEALSAFQRVWTTGNRQAALDAYLAALPASGQEGWAHVEAGLGLWNTSWYEAHTAACSAGARGPLDSQLEGTLACLDGLRSSAQVLVSALGKTDQATALAANEAVASLGSPQDCAQRDEVMRPTSAAAREVQRLLAEASVFNVLGQAAEGSARATEAAQSAANKKLYPDEARAWLAAAAARIQLSKFDDSDEAVVNALVAAEKSGDALLLAGAWSERMSHMALYQGRFPQALEYGRLAEAALSRTRGDVHIESRLATAHGFVLTQTGNHAAAVQALERARALQQKQGLTNMQAVRTLLVLANAQRGAGQLDAALATLGQLETIQDKLLPAVHPSHAATLNARGRVLLSSGDPARAMEAHARALEILEKTQANAHHEKVKTLAMIGEAQRAAKDLEAAGVSFRRALDQARALHGPEHPVRATLERDLGRLALDAGRDAEAAAALSAALAGTWPPRERALLHGELGRALLGTGKAAEAAKSAQASLGIEESPAVRFTLARALLAQSQRARAMDEAAKARQAADAGLGEEIDAWVAAQTPATRPKRPKGSAPRR